MKGMSLEVTEELIARQTPEAQASKGSRPRQEGWSGFASEASLDSLNQPGEHVPLLSPAGFNDCQQPLDKSAPRCRLRTERQLPPYHRLTQRLLGGIVRRLNSLHFHKGPQVLPMLP
jgi:hypothetical protein